MGDETRTTLRIPDDLKKQLADEAKKQNRYGRKTDYSIGHATELAEAKVFPIRHKQEYIFYVLKNIDFHIV